LRLQYAALGKSKWRIIIQKSRLDVDIVLVVEIEVLVDSVEEVVEMVDAAEITMMT
jgi:hypothetical protein